MTTTPENDGPDDFRAESEGKRQGLVAEFWDFLQENKKWWLLPIIIVVLIFGVLVFLTSTGIGPFVYPLI
jgi:hypothetical protein